MARKGVSCIVSTPGDGCVAGGLTSLSRPWIMAWPWLSQWLLTWGQWWQGRGSVIVGSSGRFQALHQAVAMAVWIRSGRVRFRHVSSRPLLAGLATAAWARVDSGLCEGTRHIYMQAGVSLVSTFFLVLVPLARANLPPCLVASDLGSGQQTWHNVRSGAGAGLWALGTPLPRNLGVCPAGSGHRGQAVVHRTAPHDGLGTWAGWQADQPVLMDHGGRTRALAVSTWRQGRHLLLLAPTDRCPAS